MSINSIRAAAPIAARHPVAAAKPIAPAAPAKPVSPAVAVKAQGPVKTGSAVTGTMVGTAAGLAGSAALSLLWLVGGNAVPLGAYGIMAGITAVATGIGFLGGDRIGKMLEKTPASGKSHPVAQVAGGAVGGALGLTGGFWLGMWGGNLLGLGGAGFVGLGVGAAVAVLGALGGAEGMKRLANRVFG